jgi:hypothetical protein
MVMHHSAAPETFHVVASLSYSLWSGCKRTQVDGGRDQSPATLIRPYYGSGRVIQRRLRDYYQSRRLSLDWLDVDFLQPNTTLQVPRVYYVRELKVCLRLDT